MSETREQKRHKGMRHKILNCTPHAIHIVDGPTYPPSGTVARLATQRIAQPPLPDGTPRISLRIQREVIDLPPPEEGQWIIVSAMVREAIRYRDDLLSPGDLVRDAEGRVIGCESLITSDRLDMGDSVPEWRIEQAWDATPSEHEATLLGERKAGSRWGRPFERDDWRELLNRWVPFWPGAEIAREGCVYMRCEIDDLFPAAVLGAVAWQDLSAEDQARVVQVDGPHGPELQLPMGTESRPGTTTATLILGQHGDREVVFAIHPGAPLCPGVARAGRTAVKLT